MREKPSGAGVYKLSFHGAALMGVAGMAASLFIGGCVSPPTSPFETRMQADLRRSVMDAARQELRDPEKQPESVTTTRVSSEKDLGITPELMTEVKEMAGLPSYANSPLPMGNDLLGQPTKTVKVSLEHMVRSAVSNNIAVQYARLGPAVSQAQVVAAEATFDWTFFTNLSFNSNNQPIVATSTTSIATSTQFQTTQSSSGLRRTLVSGGRLTMQADISYTDNKSPGNRFVPDPQVPTGLTLQWDQPLLRGAGSEVTQAEIRVARNAERTSVQTLRRDLMRVATDTEKTYWDLVQAYQDVLVLNRLLERGEKVLGQLKERAPIDANESQIAEAHARVLNRRGDLTQAQTRLELISDKLKGLANDPELPVGSWTVLVPADMAVDQPVMFSQAESIRSALRNRPEIVSAIVAIDDASIRQVVARNAKLPDLSLRLQTKLGGLADNPGDSIQQIISYDFVDYIMGLSLEVPLGNRKAEGEYRRRVLERMQTVLAYRNGVQQVVGEVQSALRQIHYGYQQVEDRRVGVLAQAYALRVLQAEKEVGPGYTVERLNVELGTQEQLAQAERQEVAALTQYNSALADLFIAMGSTLERNKIQFVVPTTDEALAGVEGTKGWAGEPVMKVKK